jgi:hypothetical protein
MEIREIRLIRGIRDEKSGLRENFAHADYSLLEKCRPGN